MSTETGGYVPPKENIEDTTEVTGQEAAEKIKEVVEKTEKDKEIEELIANAQNIEDLINNVLPKIDAMEGLEPTPADELKIIIDDIRKTGDFTSMPSDHGLREKVFKLLSPELPEKGGGKSFLDRELLYKIKLNQSELPEGEKGDLTKTLSYIDSEKIGKDFNKEIEELLNSLNKEDAFPKQTEGVSLDQKQKEKLSQSLGMPMEGIEQTLVNQKNQIENLTIQKFKEQKEKLSQSLGLPIEIIEQVLVNQKSKIENLAIQKFQAEKSQKTPRWKKTLKTVGKMGLYIGGGIGLSILTGGIAAGAAVGGARIIETLISGKIKRKEDEEARKKMQEFLISDSEEAKTLKEDLQKNILAELAVAKQQQVEGKEKETSHLGQEIQKAEEAYTGGKIKKEDLKTLYGHQKDIYKDSMRKYFEERGEGLSGEEMEERVQLAASLMEMDNNQKILEMEFSAKNKGFFTKAQNKMGEILAPLAGGKTEKEKLVTAGVFAFAGILARTCPVVRNIMMGYAGMKVGEVAASVIIRKAKRFEILKRISAAELLPEVDEKTLNLAKTQLLDQEFKKEDPSEYAKLKERIFAIEKTKIEESTDYINKANEKMEETVKEKMSKEKQAKILKWTGRIGGFAAGFFAGEALSNLKNEEAHAETKHLETKPETIVIKPEVSHTPEISNIETVAKGDNIWKLVERQLEKRGLLENLDQSQKDYMIDSLKDKVVANPEDFGLKSADLINPGQTIDFSEIFKDSSALNTLHEASKNISEEASKHIAENSEFINNILHTPVDKVSDEDLHKAINIMGGERQAGSGITHPDITHEELVKKLNENLRIRDFDEALRHKSQSSDSIVHTEAAQGVHNIIEPTPVSHSETVTNVPSDSTHETTIVGATEHVKTIPVEKATPVESEAAHHAAAPKSPEIKDTVSTQEVAEGAKVVSLEQATAEHPLIVEGAKIFQRDGKLIVNPDFGPAAIFSGDTLKPDLQFD
ncbi:MAG: hypothetical protein PHE59_04990, partial [Patescibacteria group bacterium]|nr:hypothetical protein [Patescibacteria group bacterium]